MMGYTITFFNLLILSVAELDSSNNPEKISDVSLWKSGGISFKTNLLDGFNLNEIDLSVAREFNPTHRIDVDEISPVRQNGRLFEDMENIDSLRNNNNLSPVRGFSVDDVRGRSNTFHLKKRLAWSKLNNDRFTIVQRKTNGSPGGSHSRRNVRRGLPSKDLLLPHRIKSQEQFWSATGNDNGGVDGKLILAILMVVEGGLIFFALIVLFCIIAFYARYREAFLEDFETIGYRENDDDISLDPFEYSRESKLDLEDTIRSNSFVAFKQSRW